MTGPGQAAASRSRAGSACAAVLASLLSAAALPAAGAVEPGNLVAGFPRGQLVLETAGPRCILLEVYFATTPAQRSQGLMFVESMGEFEGMYFASATPAEITMWMKNTVLSLDMLFIRQDATIGKVASRTEPQSETRIPSGGPVVGVLEVNAGFAARWKVASGTRLLAIYPPP